MLNAYFFVFLFFQTKNQNAHFIHFQPSLIYQEELGYWEVDEEIITIVQQKLISYVQDQLGADHEIVKNWNNYGFQIAGRKSDKDKREIYINAFCKNYATTWSSDAKAEVPIDTHTRMVLIFDGGNCYFWVTMDPITFSFTGHYFNPRTLRSRRFNP